MHEFQLKCDNQLIESGTSTKVLILDSLFPYLLKMNIPYNCIGVIVKNEKGDIIHDVVFNDKDEIRCNDIVVGKIEWIKSNLEN